MEFPTDPSITARRRGTTVAADRKKASSDLGPDWYVPEDIDAVRWNKKFPYSLVFLKEDASGKEATYSQYSISGMSSFTLPINPRDMTISTPFAIGMNFTLGSVVEEHSGAPLRIISFDGTTGVVKNRPATVKTEKKSVVESIFGGTIDAANTVASSIGVTNLSNVMEGDGIYKGSGLTDIAKSTDNIYYGNTGYYQFHLLKRFLERYAYLKTQKKYRDLRLGLAIWKDQEIYLVTPTSFNLRRSASQPLEYQYQLQFKAWKRVNADAGNPEGSPAYTPAVRSPGIMGQILETLDTARKAIEGARVIVGAAIGDVTRVADIAREATVLVKNTIGLAYTIGDAPVDLVNSISMSLDAASKNMNEIMFTTETRKLKGWDQRYRIQTLEAWRNWKNNGEPGFPPVSFNQLPVEFQKTMAAEAGRVNAMIRPVWQSKRDEVQQFSNSLAIAIGADTHSDLDDTEANYELMQALWALNDVVSSIDRLTANTAIDKDKQITSMEYVAALANKSGITLEQAQSKFAVPLPHGATLEWVAERYLGDPNRWHEIATLNNLQTPYSDEEGFEVSLLVKGADDKVSVASVKNLNIGQAVTIRSDAVLAEKRTILSIDKIDHAYFILTLSGEPDLHRFTVDANAVLHSFYPNTINSTQLLFIPSAEPSDEEDDLLWRGDKYDALLQAGGTDMLLSDDGDIVLGNGGEAKMAVGLQNIMQTAKIMLVTPPGTLLHHPAFGAGIKPGSSVTEQSAEDITKQVLETFSNDPLFSGVKALNIRRNAGTTAIDLALSVRGALDPVPVSFALR